MTAPLEFTTQLARQTGELLMSYYHPQGIPSQQKTDHTVITEADLASDRLIAEAIRKAFPEDGILSEEASTTAPDTPATWVIDPLDGTSNFSLGLHFWGVSIARLVDGKPDTAALYFPVVNELYVAQRGEGATLNGEAIRTHTAEDDRPVTFFTCCTRTHRRYNVDVPYKARILGAAAYDLCVVARGTALLGFQATPKIWDIAAGWLILQEAGGIVGTLHGEAPFPLKAGEEYNERSFPTLMGANQALYDKGRVWIREKA